MPTADQHRVKAAGNRRFLATIAPQDHPDWVVVAAFYTAVHIAERLRAASGHGDSQGHEDRLTYIQYKHPTIHSHFHILQNASMLARYMSNADFFAQFQPENVMEKMVTQRLAPIEQYAATQNLG